ncbi:MAG TPA: hypothetical protein VFS67_18675, partial [Polyangiaceae bacterium]|nr:hypothetical protein [Polyangiaceae bacterium]
MAHDFERNARSMAGGVFMQRTTIRCRHTLRWVGVLLLLAGCEGEHREYDGSRFALLPDASTKGAAQPPPVMTGGAAPPQAMVEPETTSHPTRLEQSIGSQCNTADDCASK